MQAVCKEYFPVFGKAIMQIAGLQGMRDMIASDFASSRMKQVACAHGRLRMPVAAQHNLQQQ